jgi:hypothetical protein
MKSICLSCSNFWTFINSFSSPREDGYQWQLSTDYKDNAEALLSPLFHTWYRPYHDMYLQHSILCSDIIKNRMLIFPEICKSLQAPCKWQGFSHSSSQTWQFAWADLFGSMDNCCTPWYHQPCAASHSHVPDGISSFLTPSHLTFPFQSDTLWPFNLTWTCCNISFFSSIRHLVPTGCARSFVWKLCFTVMSANFG